MPPRRSVDASDPSVRQLLLRLLFRQISAETEAPQLDSSQDPAEPLGAVRQATQEERAAGAICRVCFETGDGVLIAPCACIGSQQWIHEACLRHWQRSLAGSQGAERASRCSVCTAPFALPPPPLPTAPVAVGSLLVASQVLSGSFKESVVLLCHIDNRGVPPAREPKPSFAAPDNPRCRGFPTATGVHGLVLTSPQPPADGSPPAEAVRRALDGRPHARAEWRRGGPVCGGRLGVTTYSALHNVTDAPDSLAVVGQQRGDAPAPPSPGADADADADAADAAIAAASAAARAPQADADSVVAAAAAASVAGAGGGAPLESEAEGAGAGAGAGATRASRAVWHSANRRDGDPAGWNASELRDAIGRLAACPPPGPAGPSRILIFVGHCRWGRQQLSREFNEGRWGTCKGTVADVFDVPTEQMWQRLRESGRLSYAPAADQWR